MRSPDQLKKGIANPHIHSRNKYQQAPICVSGTVLGSGIRCGTCLYRADIPGGSQTTNSQMEREPLSKSNKCHDRKIKQSKRVEMTGMGCHWG